MSHELLELNPEQYADARRQIAEKAQKFGLNKALLRYVTHEPSRRAFHDFVHNFVGDLDKRVDGAANPEIEEGGFMVRAWDKVTRGGSVIVVRHRQVPEPQPEDYYVRIASIRNLTDERFFVTNHELTPSDTSASAGREVFALDKHPATADTEIHPLHTGNPFRDLLDEWDLSDMYAGQQTRSPRLVLAGQGGGDSSYFYDGDSHDLLLGDIRMFEQRLAIFESYFGDLARLAQIPVPEPVTI